MSWKTRSDADAYVEAVVAAVQPVIDQAVTRATELMAAGEHGKAASYLSASETLKADLRANASLVIGRALERMQNAETAVTR